MDYKRFILVTDYDNTGEDVLVFSETVSRGELIHALLAKKQSFGECYEIKEEEISFYCFDPLYLTAKTEANIKELARNYKRDPKDYSLIKYK
jgi:hypothetical protein